MILHTVRIKYAYGDTMYHWHDKVRRQNMLEEAADLVVYMSSGGSDVGLC